MSRASDARRRIFRSLEHAFAFIGVVALVYHGFFHLSVIVSGSMAPTLQGNSTADGDYVLTERITYRVRAPRRWEVIMFPEPELQVQVMKRVVGLPGETVTLNQGTQTFSINGAAIARPQSLMTIKYLAFGGLAAGKAAQAGNGYYVLGDFSADSQDSRWLGPVSPGQIQGRPWLVVWPPSHIRFVNP
ncbi:MAG TPA: signal peptidase I [Vicinamibacterales bacterium]|jgi:signal peptidase I|nr:signal peptidase I [Vicinamibacterales bacterium]